MLLTVLIVMKIFSCSTTPVTIDLEPSARPKFDRLDETVSVVVGKRAVLPCFITLPEGTHYRTGSLKVIWMKTNSSSVLTMETRAVNGDPRISILRAYAEDWSLQIDEIDEDDAGLYRCIIDNGMFKTVTLDVKVPPRIIDELTTEAYPPSIVVGSNFTMKCNAQGKPQPKIRIISYDQYDNSRVISEETEVTLINISRQTNRRYQCVASNGYPPDVARSFQLTIHYQPEVKVFIDDQEASRERIVEKASEEVRLKCQIEMNPIEQFFWTKNGEPLIENVQTYQIENAVISEVSVRLSNGENRAVFSCSATNSLGTQSKKILLKTLEMTSRSTVSHRHRKRPKYFRTSTNIIHPDENLRLIQLSSKATTRFDSNLFLLLLLITVNKF